MTQIYHFDFCASPWNDIADTLCEFRNTANERCSYAYVKAESGLQLSMVEKLVADLDLDDHICTETVAAAAYFAVREGGKQRSRLHLPFGLERLWSKPRPHRVARLG